MDSKCKDSGSPVQCAFCKGKYYVAQGQDVDYSTRQIYQITSLCSECLKVVGLTADPRLHYIRKESKSPTFSFSCTEGAIFRTCRTQLGRDIHVFPPSALSSYHDWYMFFLLERKETKKRKTIIHAHKADCKASSKGQAPTVPEVTKLWGGLGCICLHSSQGQANVGL